MTKDGGYEGKRLALHHHVVCNNEDKEHAIDLSFKDLNGYIDKLGICLQQISGFAVLSYIK